MINNTTIFILIVIVINYLTLYQKDKLLADIIFMGCGLAMIWLESTNAVFGFILLAIAIINAIKDYKS